MSPFLLFHLCVVLFFGVERAVRTVAGRQVPSAQCANTAGGRHFLTDSHGYVCTRRDLDYTSGCCYSGELHSCETCHEADQCCSSYEHCVSCCLKPEFNAQMLVKTQFRIHNQPTTGKWDGAFQYCMGKCRTHKRSTVHENAFIDDRHFCFSDSSRPKITTSTLSFSLRDACPETPPSLNKTDEDPMPIPEGVTIHAGAKGADCDATCTQAGLHCAPEAVQAISSCDILRDKFECEAGCAAGNDMEEVPAYVVYGTPKPLYPTMCFIASLELQMGACGASQPHLERLCACAPWKPAEAVVSIESGAGNGQQDAPEGSGHDTASTAGAPDEGTKSDLNGTAQASPVESKAGDQPPETSGDTKDDHKDGAETSDELVQEIQATELSAERQPASSTR